MTATATAATTTMTTITATMVPVDMGDLRVLIDRHCRCPPGIASNRPGCGGYQPPPGVPLHLGGRARPRYGAGVSMLRRTTPAGRLARMGFADARRAQLLVTEDLALEPEGADADLLEALAAAADPDLALTALAR